MRNEIQSFTYNLKEVEVINLNNQPLFNAKQVGEILGMNDVTVRRHIQDMSDKQKVKVTNEMVKNSDVHSMNGRKFNNAGENFLTEAGVYKLVFKSRKPEAEKFTDWIAEEVLPSIRKYGAYMTDETLDKVLEDSGYLNKLAQELKSERDKVKELEQQTQYLENKYNTVRKSEQEYKFLAEAQNKMLMKEKDNIFFARTIRDHAPTISIGEMSKILRQNGVETGQKRLFKWLRDNGYLISRNGYEYNLPTQRAMELGIFAIREETYWSAKDETSYVTRTTMVTGKGQIYFINKFVNESKLMEEVI